MPTIIWNGTAPTDGNRNVGGGYQTTAFSHPRELRHWGYPKPPLQKISDWPTILSDFQTLMNNGKYEAILTFPIENYVSVTISDVPSGVRSALKDWLSYNCEGKSIPTTLVGPLSDWVNAGTTVTRAGFD